MTIDVPNSSERRGSGAEPQDPHPDTLRIMSRRARGLAPDPAPAASKEAVSTTLKQKLSSGLERLGLKAAPEAKSVVAREAPAEVAAELLQQQEQQVGGLNALALSGGGIRSATLSLGVLQAIAMKHRRSAGGSGGATGAACAVPPASFDESMLSDFPYLSTVSGGGYIGAFLTSLFIPNRLRKAAVPSQAPEAAADDVIKVLCNEPPGRIRAVPAMAASPARAPAMPAGVQQQEQQDSPVLRAPLAWLRDNGRYLTPTGSGDTFYAACLAIRNFVSVHYVIGSALLGALGALALLEGFVAYCAGPNSIAILTGGLMNDWWVSPLFLLAALVLAVWSVPAGAAYWMPYPADERDQSSWMNGACLGFVAVAVLFLCVGFYSARWGDLFWKGAPWWYGAGAATVALVFYWAAWAFGTGVNGLRTRLTRLMALSLQVVCVLLALAVVDTLSHTIYNMLTKPDVDAASAATRIATPAGALAAVIWLIRKFAETATKPSSSSSSPSLLSKLPLQWLAGAAGIVILFMMAVGWGLAAVALMWQGGPLVTVEKDTAQVIETLSALTVAGNDSALFTMVVAKVAALLPAAKPVAVPTIAAALLVGMSLLLSLVIGQFPSFINLSSLQSFYASRLTRAYLGASNGERLDPANAATQKRERASAAEPMASDQVSLDDFINDQGKLTTYAPVHLINVTMNNTDAPGEQLVQRDRKGQPIVVTAQGFSVDGGAVEPFRAGQPHLELDRKLNLGQWTGISGAAFSTGVGRQTSLGMALLLGAANVRLGAWWNSGVGTKARDWASMALSQVFPTQTYLFSEFTARFHGLARPYQYLSDGGHFENTAMYELLRPERHVSFIVACDHGADPEYRFDDLANLIRLVRIDMQIELTVETGAASDPVLGKWFGVPADFSPGDDAQKKADRTQSLARATPPHEPVAILLRARRGCPAATQTWILLLKPRVRSDSAADVLQYANTHPAFPQEPTADQFFDDEQWESYRKLAFDNASKVLSEPVWSALHNYISRYP